MRAEYLLQLIVGVICYFLCGRTGFVCGTVVRASGSDSPPPPPNAPHAVHMEEIKVRHGAESEKWGACFDTLCFRSNSQGSQ